jgi:hypothetical protein
MGGGGFGSTSLSMSRSQLGFLAAEIRTHILPSGSVSPMACTSTDRRSAVHIARRAAAALSR